jgi:hypothetical protein
MPITEIENEANELLLGASRAIDHNDALAQIRAMPEASHALEMLLGTYGQNPHKLIACAFLLGAYMGLQHHDMKKFTGE